MLHRLLLFAGAVLSFAAAAANGPLPARATLCLNGDAWTRVFSTAATPPAAGWAAVRVPDGWGGRYDGATKKQTAAWYRLAFPVPADWQGSRVVLQFDRVHEKGDLFVNGRACGTHVGWAVPWAADITAAVVYGKDNVLELRVERAENRADVGWGDTLLAGLEGDVYLCKRPPVHAGEVRIVTSVRQQTLATQATIVNQSAAPCTVTVNQTVFLHGKPVFQLDPQTVTLPAGASRTVDARRDWADPVLWGFAPYGRPELYYLVTTLAENGRETDQTATRFGFREFWCQGTEFYFNGKPFYLKGDGLNFAGPAIFYDRSYLTAYYRASRDLNVNTIRPHVGEMFPPSVVFEVADELGMLVIPQASAPDLLDPTCFNWYRETYQGYMRAHLNHPSIIMWGIDNESCMQRDTTPCPEVWKALKQLAVAAKAVDTTRPLLFAGDLKLGLAPRYGIDFPLEIYSIHPYGDPIYNEVMRLCMLYGYNGKLPILLDEIFSGEQEPFSDKTTQEQYLTNRFAYFKAFDNLGDFWYRAIVDGKKKVKAIAGAIPWCASECCYYGPVNERETNLTPWTTSKTPDTAVQVPAGAIPVPYPALSGPGMKVPDYWLNRMFGHCFNYFDPSLPIYSPNVTFGHVKRAFHDVDGLPPGPLAGRRMAELVVAAFDPQGKPLAGTIIWLTPHDGQPTGRQGVFTDRQGKAWFVVKEEGAYALSVEGTPLNKAVTVRFPALTKQAGYGHVKWETLGPGSTAADQERLARPTPYERKVISPAAKISSTPVEDVRPGPFAPDAAGFIRDWLLCGPFPNAGDRVSGFTGYKTDYLTGQRGETGIEPKRGMSHDVVFPESKYWKAGRTTGTWRQYHAPASKTNLGSLTNPDVELRMSPPQFVVGYAACYVESPAERPVLLAIGSDDGYKAWLNHHFVAGDPAHGEAIKDAHLLPVTLHKGRNLLLIKVDQSFNGWEFYARFLDPQTKAPVNDISIMLE